MYVTLTLKEWMERARQSFRANLAGSDAYVWPNNVYATAKVLAGLAFEITGFASYISRQKFAFTAPDIESLRLHGEEFGIPQNPAGPAVGNAVLSALGAVSVDVGALFTRMDNVTFRAVAGGSLTGAGDLTFQVVSVSDGKTANTAGGAPLAIVSGVTDVAGGATVAVDADGISLGVDVEDIESYRARILFRKRNPPHGGAAADYVMWAGQIPGVSFYADRPTVYVNRLWAGPGTVRVFPLMLDLYADGIPQAVDIDRVRDFIETVRPAGASVSVAAPTAVVVNIVIAGLEPDTTEVREAVLAELRDMFRRQSRVAGTDTAVANMPYLASPFTFSRSWIWQAIANASGEERHIVTLPAADVALDTGQMATLGTVTFA